MDLSDKQKGNESFRKGKFNEAIKNYSKYVLEDHSDNQNAYFNISLCQSKLGRHKECVEAAEKALQLDPNYSKCYYRLALQYMNIPDSHYLVFINAIRFLKLASENQIAERQEMQKIVKHYKQKLSITKKGNKWQNIDGIIQETKKLMQKREINETVDKYVGEWPSEWESGTQDNEAKVLQIGYIMNQIDYDYGLNVGYLCINQAKTPAQKKYFSKEIQNLRKQANKEQPFDTKVLQIETEQETQQETINNQIEKEDDQNLFQTDENVETKNQPKWFPTNSKDSNNTTQSKTTPKPTKKVEQKKINQKAGTKISTQPREDVKSSTLEENQPKNKKQIMQEMLLKKKRQVQQVGGQQLSVNKKQKSQIVQKPKQKKQNTELKDTAKLQSNSTGKKTQLKINNQKSQNIIKKIENADEKKAKDTLNKLEVVNQIKTQNKQVKNQKPKLPEVSPPVGEKILKQSIVKQQPKKQIFQEHYQLVQEELQASFNKYCIHLSKQKDIMKATYQCVLNILSASELNSQVKGKLLILLKKRHRIFLAIMKYRPINEQNLINSLLKKNDMDEYAIDVAPMLYKP